MYTRGKNNSIGSSFYEFSCPHYGFFAWAATTVDKSNYVYIFGDPLEGTLSLLYH